MPLFLFDLFMCTFGIASIKDKASSLVVYVIFLNIEIFGGIVPETRRTITCIRAISMLVSKKCLQGNHGTLFLTSFLRSYHYNLFSEMPSVQTFWYDEFI